MPANQYRSLVAAIILAIVPMPSTSALAQTSSTIAGTIKDTSGGIIPGASVTLVSEREISYGTSPGSPRTARRRK